jgi:glucuronate isomerase
MLGHWVTGGEAPHDMKLLGTMVENLSFNNACDYFAIKLG